MLAAETHSYCDGIPVFDGCLGSKRTRVAWVADFT